MRSLLALGLLVLTFAANGSAAPIPVRPGSAPAARPAAKPAPGHKSIAKTFAAESKRVTWTYDKLHHPELVAAALRDVAAGKLPRSSVETLASKKALNKLLKVKLPERDPSTDAPTLGPAPKGEARAQAKGAGSSAWGELAGVLGAMPEYSPKKLTFPAAYDKEVKRASVWFTANADGHVTATLPTGAPFRIKKIVSYDGSYDMTQLGPIAVPWDWRDTEPFALSVRAGQQYAVVVEFAPEFDLFAMTAGVKKGKLRVKDEGAFTVNVPLSAMFNGIHVAGVVLSPTEDWLTVDAYVPANKHQVKTKLQVANLGSDSRTATITADALPSGMTLVGSPSVDLGVGDVKLVDVTLQLDGGQYGYGQQLVLRATAPGGLTSSAAMSVNVVKTEKQWEFSKTVEGVDINVVYRVDSEGHWFYAGTVWNKSSALPWDVNVQLHLGDDFEPYLPFFYGLGTMTGLYGPKIAYQHNVWDGAAPGSTSWNKDFYADLIARKAQFEITLESRP
jgi:hypothetical protein